MRRERSLHSLFDFRLLPWIVYEEGVRIWCHPKAGSSKYRLLSDPGILPGSAKLTYLDISFGESLERLSWQEFFFFLARDGFSIVDLFPMLKVRTLKERSENLQRLLPQSSLSYEGDKAIFILPKSYRKQFVKFLNKEPKTNKNYKSPKTVYKGTLFEKLKNEKF